MWTQGPEGFGRRVLFRGNPTITRKVNLEKAYRIQPVTNVLIFRLIYTRTPGEIAGTPGAESRELKFLLVQGLTKE